MSDKDEYYDLTEIKNKSVTLLKNKKVQWAIILILLTIIAFWSASIRTSNWHLLTDSTTGEKIPLALDPFYFLRISETLVENNGELSAYDPLRHSPGHPIRWSREILPQVNVFVLGIANMFGEYTIQEIHVFSPVLFYFIGLFIFFLLGYQLTKTKIVPLIASIFLAFVPAYLYRTMAGFSDHESIGMMAFFLALLTFTIAFRTLETSNKKSRIALLAALTALTTVFSIASWGGIANFMFMIFPTSFLLWWMMKTREEDKQTAQKGIIFYGLWIILLFAFGPLFNHEPNYILTAFLLKTSNLPALFVLAFTIVDYTLITQRKKLGFIKTKHRLAYSFGITAILGVIGLTTMGRNIWDVLVAAWIQVFHPWGVQRVGLTVAENAQPYLTGWIAQTGKALFWMFVAGMVLIGHELSKGLSKKKDRLAFVLLWTIMISASLFSRIAPNHIMNGENVISQIVYAGGVLITLFFMGKIYFRNKVTWKVELIILASWMFFTLLSGRAAQRLFFAITPFVVLLAAYFIWKIGIALRDAEDKNLRTVLLIFLLVLGIAAAHSTYSFERSISQQATFTGPSANAQWQKAMSWVDNNTPKEAIFAHWWDYGYWIQSLGNRATIADGGRFQGSYRDHLIGRYILTTPNPQTAMSFMKSNNVTHLLIDPTDVGKYPAYSRIGSDEEGHDRFSAVPVMQNDPRQTVETGNMTRFVYTGGYFVDEDITYTTNDNTVFLPREKAVLAGIILGIQTRGNGTTIEQPVGVYVYKNQQYRLPIRYAYINGEIADYQTGIEAIARVMPAVQNGRVNQLGAVIYLSPKVGESLFAQLYLMNDPFNNYPDVTLAHQEEDPVITDIKRQGAQVGEFVILQGFRGPIKIWSVTPGEEVSFKKEFLVREGTYAAFDNLTLTQST